LLAEHREVMMEFTDFHFLRPWWLLTFIPLVWLLWRLHNMSKSGEVWAKACDAHLLPHLLTQDQQKSSQLPYWILATVGVLMIIALAGPVWKKLPQPVFKTQAATVFLLDLSRSMNSPDITPSRIERAKHKLLDMLKLKQEGQSALIVYSGEPNVVSPLSDDTNTIAAMVPVLSPDIMPTQGSRVDIALQKAEDLLKQAGLASGQIIVIADEVNGEAALAAAEAAEENNYPVSILAIGTEQGAPIPIAGGGFLKDSQGGIVIPNVDFHAMRTFASKGGGRFERLTFDDKDINSLLRHTLIDPQFATQKKSSEREIDLWQEEGPWLLLLALPLVAMGFRRGWLLIILLGCVPLFPQPAYAFEWSDLWLTKDQQAQQLLEQGEASAAAKTFDDPDWQGTSYYKAGEYQKALESFNQSETAESDYNRGNALTHLGRFEEALQAYDQILAKSPEHADAAYNKALVKRLLEQQEQDKQESQQQDSSDSEQQDSQNQEADASEQNQNQQNQQSQQQSADSQQSEQQQADQQQAQQDASQSQSNQEANKEQDEAQTSEPNQQEQSPEKPEQSSMAQQHESSKDNSDQENQTTAEQQLTSEQKESQQAMEQWLRRIPDDPGGLLREKFRRQYQRRQHNTSELEQPW